MLETLDSQMDLMHHADDNVVIVIYVKDTMAVLELRQHYPAECT